MNSSLLPLSPPSPPLHKVVVYSWHFTIVVQIIAFPSVFDCPLFGLLVPTPINHLCCYLSYLILSYLILILHYIYHHHRKHLQHAIATLNQNTTYLIINTALYLSLFLLQNHCAVPISSFFLLNFIFFLSLLQFPNFTHLLSCYTPLVLQSHLL